MDHAARRRPREGHGVSHQHLRIPAAETTIDQARNEMTASGMPPVVEQIVG
jgi:hypothetical protein